jgi:hypothetical protein
VLNSNSIKFNEFIFNVDLGFKGPAYTWTSRPNFSDAIYARLDRVLVNTDWCGIFPEAYVNHLFRVHSDHTLIMLRTKAVHSRG